MARYRTVRSKRPYTHYRDCPECGKPIEYWWTSGMSQCFPHFYCTDCGSPIWRAQDQKRIWDDRPEEVLREDIAAILSELPKCLCGGRYELDAGPRCPHCGYDFNDHRPFEERVYDPYMILVEGAKMVIGREK